MALRVSPVSRNLAMKVTFMFLELEDMLGLGLLCARRYGRRQLPVLRQVCVRRFR